MKILFLLSLAFILASSTFQESRAQEAAPTTDSWAVAPSANYGIAPEPVGDTPESTRMLTYLSAFRDFSGLEASPSFVFNALGFLRGGEESDLHSSSRVLSTESVTLDGLDSEEIFSFLFQSFLMRNGETDPQILEVGYVRRSNLLNTYGGLLSRDDARNPMLSFVGRALQFRSNYDSTDAQLQDARYTLD